MKKLEDFDSEIIGNCTLYYGDCSEIIPMLPVVDCIITDPPYGINIAKASGKDWDRFPCYNWSLLVKPILSYKGSILCFGSKSFSYEMEKRLREQYHFQNRFVWVKNAAGFQYTRRQPRTQHEDIIWVSKSKDYYFDLYGGHKRADWYKVGCKGKSTVFKMKGTYKSESKQFKTATTVFSGLVKASLPIIERTKHPSQKPVNIYQELTGIFCPDDGILFDPFMGSGTGGVAAIKSGRHFIGIEKDRDCFDMACERIKQAYNQPDLFV